MFLLQSLAVADVIYKMDWNLLGAKRKQTVLIMMMRARRPIQLTGSNSVIVMSIETFLRVSNLYNVYTLNIRDFNNT